MVMLVTMMMIITIKIMMMIVWHDSDVDVMMLTLSYVEATDT